ncbi:hypothetical protein K1719_020779 [Acacia pycnantha]|nr:hypothetical protein K1719_020779 [Acacia pycnantha]
MAPPLCRHRLVGRGRGDLKIMWKLLKDAFSNAFSRWEKVTGLSFTETPSFDQSDIRIVFLKWDETEVVGGRDFLDSATTWASRHLFRRQ